MTNFRTLGQTGLEDGAFCTHERQDKKSRLDHPAEVHVLLWRRNKLIVSRRSFPLEDKLEKIQYPYVVKTEISTHPSASLQKV